MRVLILAAILCNPICVVKCVGHKVARVATNAFYATTNFYVNHIQPNQKGEAGKPVDPKILGDWQ